MPPRQFCDSGDMLCAFTRDWLPFLHQEKQSMTGGLAQRLGSPGYVIRNCGRNQIISCPATSAQLGSASLPQIGHNSLSYMDFIFLVFHLCLRLFPNSSALLFAILHLSLFLPKSLMQSPVKLYLPRVIVMSLTVLMWLLKQVVHFSSGSINKQVLTILSVFINLLLVA